jgi:excisionase family DNA binding protein
MQLLTLSQMADNLGCSAKVFSKDVHDKKIPFHAVGKRKKFDPVEVRAHLKALGIHAKAAKAAVRVRARVQGRGRFAEALGL